jgi:hypothetical protein
MRVAANGVRCSSARWCSGSGVASATFNSAARWLGCGCSAEAAAQASVRRGEAKRGGVVKSAPGVCSGCVSRARLQVPLRPSALWQRTGQLRRSAQCSGSGGVARGVRDRGEWRGLACRVIRVVARPRCG